MKFTDSHEWIVEEGEDVVRLGISAYAQKELGEIVYVELPKVGKRIAAKEEVAILESTKAATDFYSPVTGTIIEVNQRLKESPGLINHSPEQEGWICRVRLSHPEEGVDWLDRAAYEAMLAKNE